MPKRKESTELNVILNILDDEPKHTKDWIPLFKTPLFYDSEDELNDNSGKADHSYKQKEEQEVRAIKYKLKIRSIF